MTRIEPMRFQGQVILDPVTKKFILKLKNIRYWKHYIKRFSGPVVVTLETQKKVRSLKSNRRYWGAVIGAAMEDAAEFSGYTKEEVHEIFKQRHLQPQIIKFKSCDYPIWTTKNLTDGEFTEFGMKVEQDLAEMGIRIKTVKEYYEGI